MNNYPLGEPPLGYPHDDMVDAIMFAMHAYSLPPKLPWYKRLWNWLKRWL